MEYQKDPGKTGDLNEMAGQVLARTGAWIDRFGGRLAGTQACRGAAEAICAELQRVCGHATLEEFSTRPGAFYGFYQIDAVLYLIGLFLLLVNQPLAAGIVLLAMVTMAGLEFGWYVEVYDWLYRPKRCANVTAVLEPSGSAVQQLILSGHHDSARELKFLRRRQKLYGLKIIIPDATRILAMVTAWAWVIWRAAVGGQPPFLLPAEILLLIGIYPVFTKFFLFGPEATPGAGDNLAASGMLVSLAELFRQPEQPGKSILQQTRLIFTSFDAEESGLRGSRAWVKEHRAELASLPTYALNIDSIYQRAEIQFLESDLNSHVRLDGPLVQRCMRIAEQRGIPVRSTPMRFGGGATDAAELARAGVMATTLIGMPSGVIRDGLVYHTLKDTVEAVEPGAVEACLAIAEGLARDLDQIKTVNSF